MNRVQALKEKLEGKLPKATITLDEPEKQNGTWFLDVRTGKRAVTVEWRPSMGFGVSTPGGEYGVGPDELYDDLDGAFERIVGLLQNGGKTEPPDQSTLRRLREVQGVSQVDLAELMGIKQASLSKMERRADMNVSTLKRIIEALGGRLEVRANFRGRMVAIDIQQEDEAGSKKRAS
jgi:DNA-binding XRE family transcriptional regulator